jgi:hypothetical protein
LRTPPTQLDLAGLSMNSWCIADSKVGPSGRVRAKPVGGGESFLPLPLMGGGVVPYAMPPAAARSASCWG